jgi:hypothetical protein
MVGLKRLGSVVAVLGLAAIGTLAAPHQANAWWRGGVGIGIWVPPVVVAPPVYAAPPVVYAPPPVAYAPPPVAYAPPYAPYGYYAPRRVWVPAGWVGGFWRHGHWR